MVHLVDPWYTCSATDLFAFQNTQPRIASKSNVPEIIRLWPTLQADLVTASISNQASFGRSSESDDRIPEDRGDAIPSTLLVVSDNAGRLHLFMDGSYPLGSISSHTVKSVTMLAKLNSRPAFFAYGNLTDHPTSCMNRPSFVDIPLLKHREARDMAKLSSTARELCWYSLRVVRDMKSQWYGSESQSGAREIGPKWLESLTVKYREHANRKIKQSSRKNTSLT